MSIEQQDRIDLTEYQFEELIDLHRPIPRWKIALLKYHEWDGTQLAAGFENELAILERFLLRIRLDNLAFNKVIGALLSSKVVHLFWLSSQDVAHAGDISYKYGFAVENHS